MFESGWWIESLVPKPNKGITTLLLAIVLMGWQVGCNSSNKEESSKPKSQESLTSSVLTPSVLEQQKGNLGFYVVSQEPPYKQGNTKTIKTYNSDGSYAIEEIRNSTTVTEWYNWPTYYNYTHYDQNGKEIYSISELWPRIGETCDSIKINEENRNAVHVTIGNPDDGYIFDEVCSWIPERYLVGDKMCYIAPRWKTSTIILWDRVLETGYSHIANVQEYDGNIVYIWWNDWNKKVIVVVGENGNAKKTEVTEPELPTSDTSLLPYVGL